MGICISATNSGYTFDMGYGGFFNLRANIADIIDKDFGALYRKARYCMGKQELEDNMREAYRIAGEKNLYEKYGDVIDFLYMSDAKGTISHRTCKHIYDLIKDVDFGNKIFRYAAQAGNDYEDLKKFLKECYSNRRKMRWY